MLLHECKAVCPVCGEPIRWKEYKIHREDGYFDWRMDVWCGCGEVMDPDLLAAVRREYEQYVGEELAKTQRKNMGKELHDFLEEKLRARGDLPVGPGGKPEKGR